MTMVSERIEAETVSQLDNSQMKPNWSNEPAFKTLCGTVFLESIPHSELFDGNMFHLITARSTENGPSNVW